MTKFLITALILLLPLILNLLEQKKRREKAQEAMRKVKKRQGQAPEAPKPQQSLADWIEDLRQRQEMDVPGKEPTRRPAPDPLDDPAFDRQFEVEFVDEEEFVEALPEVEERMAVDIATDPSRAPEIVLPDRTSDQVRRAPGAQRAQLSGLSRRGASLTPNDLREAIILREILDRPVALRPRHRR